MKTYYLKDKEFCIVAKFEVTNLRSGSLDGVCYEAIEWSGVDFKDVVQWSFVADIYFKFDSCTHWWFYGEDYDPQTKNEKDSYYHLCGCHSFTSHIRDMCFAWKVAADILSSADGSDYSRDVYYENSTVTSELIDLMLKDYTIKEVETNEKTLEQIP